jgi:ribonucleoside-diphosphate reductase alpha chain
VVGTGGKSIKVRVGADERDFDVGEIADTVGGAITDLLLARQRNKTSTTTTTAASSKTSPRPSSKSSRPKPPRSLRRSPSINAREIHDIIERALVHHNAHDVARTLAEKRKRSGDELLSGVRTTSAPQPIIVNAKVIRRSGQLVAWNHDKIEIAVRKSFLSMELDSSPAVAVAEAVSRAVAEEGKQFVHIEDVQNLVEEELMKQGHFKVARSYIQYRAMRNTLRDAEESKNPIATADDSEQQQSLILVRTNRRQILPLGRSRPQTPHRLRHARPRPLPQPRPRSR